MAQQTSALTHLRLEAGSMSVTHSDTSKRSLSHSISITCFPGKVHSLTLKTPPHAVRETSGEKLHVSASLVLKEML